MGRIVHFVSYDTPGGEYASECRAAVVTEVRPLGNPHGPEGVGLCVLNPTGQFFVRGVRHDEDEHAGGTWHWPERVAR